MPTRKEWERREKQRRGDEPLVAESDEAGEAGELGDEPAPPLEPGADSNPAHSVDPKDAYTGRSDQDVTRNTGTGAGGATEYGGGNKNHPSRIAGKPPGG